MSFSGPWTLHPRQDGHGQTGQTNNGQQTGQTGQNTTTTNQGGHGRTKGPSNEDIAAYMNYAIFGVIFILFLLTLPRAWARYRHPTARRSTLRFRSSSKNNDSTEHVNSKRQGTSSSGASTSGDDGPSNNKTSALTFGISSASQIEEHSIPSLVSPPAQPVPSRVASLTAKFHRVSRYLHLPLFTTGYNYGQAIAFSIYAFFICFGCFYKTFTPAFGPRRAGYIATGQYPIIFALGAKNNVVGFMLGVGYEKLNAWHRWVGKMMFVSSMAHVVGYLVRWTTAGRLVLGSQRQPHGWAAFAGLCLLSVISIPPIRKYSYGMFWHAHWMGYVMMIVGMVWHADDGWKWSVAASVIVIFDQICRVFKTSFTYATITAIPELGCTRVEVPHLTCGWRAGQHVRLRTVSTAMGAFDALEAHPMTIATVSESAGREGLVLYVKKAGDWSNRLYQAAKGPEKGEISEKGIESEGEKSTKMRMIIEGPYGGPGHDVLSSFSSAFIVAGGSGITFGLSSVDEIIREAEKGLAKTRLIEFIWVVQDPASLLHMMLVLQTFVNRVARLSTLDIKIDVFYTRAMAGNIPETLNNGFNLPANVTLSPGRPKFDAMLDHFLDKTRQLPEGPEGLNGTVVGCCGPESLCHSVKHAELSIKGRKRDAVGGIEMVEELFNW